MDDLTTSQAPESTPSMADTIRETLQSINSREDEAPEATTEAPEATPEEPAKIAARDEAGKFAKQEEPKEGTEQPAEGIEEKKYPRWNKQAIEAFNKIPDGPEKEQIRQAALLRDKSFFEGIEAYKAPAQNWSKLEQALGNENINYLRSKAGGDEVAGLKGLVQLEQWANAKPQEFIQWFAKNANIDLGNMQQAEQSYQDPQVQQLQQKLSMIEQREGQRAQLEAQNKLQSVEQDLAKFQESADKAGYLDDWQDSPRGLVPGPFSQKFVNFLKTGVASNYAEAYEMAKAATPEIRDAEATRLRSEAVEAERKAQAARNAKRVQGVNVNSRGNLPPTEPIGTMADTIRATYRRLNGA